MAVERQKKGQPQRNVVVKDRRIKKKKTKNVGKRIETIHLLRFYQNYKIGGLMEFDIQTLLISAGVLAVVVIAIRINISKKKNSDNKIGNVKGDVNIGDKN